MLRILFLLAACARVGALNCRSDSCGDIANDCCAPPGEARSCTRPGFTVQSGGVSLYGCPGQDDIYQCCTMEEDCVPDPGKCDDSTGGDCCTSKYAQTEERRCRDGWVPIYTGIGCGWLNDVDANMFTCYPPSCSALPADNCGPNSCSTCMPPSLGVCMEFGGVDDDCCGLQGTVGCAAGYTFSLALAMAEGGTWARPPNQGFFSSCGSYYGGNTCCTPVSEDCSPVPGKCDSSIGGDCCTSKDTQAEERKCRDGWVPIYTGIGCYYDQGNEFTCYPPSCSALPADNCGPNSCDVNHVEPPPPPPPPPPEDVEPPPPPPPPPPEEDCNPNSSKCDSSIGGDCCTARYTSHEDRRCRDDWIPIYTGVGCGWPHHDEGNMFTCYPPTCSELPEDNCGPNSCYDDGDIAKVVIIVVSVISAVAIIGTLGGVYGCYRSKCCCFSQQPKPPQPMAQSAVAQPVIPTMVQPATMAYQAQPAAYQAQPGMTVV